MIKDSYIDYKNFYNSILLLKNLEKLTYNHYCFFNKKKGDTIGAGLALPSLKIFKLEFPSIEEPNFETNNWRFKSHEKKFNFIADLKKWARNISKFRRNTICKLQNIFKSLKKKILIIIEK